MTPPLTTGKLPARRRQRGHPDDPGALRAHVLGERARISKLSRIRELVLGFQDGLLVPLGVVTGLAGASVGATAVIVGGVATAVAGALAMGTGAHLSSRAENQLFRTELADHPEVERLELELLLVSLVPTGFARFGLGLGLFKGRVARLALLRSGLQVLVSGGMAAGIGYLIGNLGPKLFAA